MPAGAVDGEFRSGQRQAFDLAGAIAALDPRDHIADANRLALDADGLSDQATAAMNLPTLDDGVARERTARLADDLRAFWKPHLQRQPHAFALRRNLPQHLKAIVAGLAQFQVGRAEYIGVG